MIFCLITLPSKSNYRPSCYYLKKYAVLGETACPTQALHRGYFPAVTWVKWVPGHISFPKSFKALRPIAGCKGRSRVPLREAQIRPSISSWAI